MENIEDDQSLDPDLDHQHGNLQEIGLRQLDMRSIHHLGMLHVHMTLAMPRKVSQLLLV